MWRIDLPSIPAEGSTYELLEEAHVPNIAHCIASGDVSTTTYHATKTSAYTSALWACPTDPHFIPHRHYCLVLDIIGRSLLEFESSLEMVKAVCDAIIGRLNNPIADEPC
jgi:hypothetical protein